MSVPSGAKLIVRLVPSYQGVPEAGVRRSSSCSNDRRWDGSDWLISVLLFGRPPGSGDRDCGIAPSAKRECDCEFATGADIELISKCKLPTQYRVAKPS